MIVDKKKVFRIRLIKFSGDRSFLPWKGSVLDSVVGAFLTQNVSDHLSSSAFMTLAAKFPIKTTSYEKNNKDLAAPDDKQEVSVVFTGPKFDKEMDDSNLEEMEVEKEKESSKVDNKGTKIKSSLIAEKEVPPSVFSGDKKKAIRKKNMNKEKKVKLMEKQQQYWDRLRKMHTKSPRDINHTDSIDWEGVRSAQASEVVKAIASRGQHNVIAGRIQRLLNSLMDLNGSMDLEWLRYAPPKEVKEYLLNIYGLGLKSVECIRLLTLHHIAFPVDVNVGRIVVRLGWVPLQPLPESVQIHNLEMFPDSNKIQQYLWPRLCTLDHLTLYELHYQLITFGKVHINVFCTKKKPNCNACPMSHECKYFASVTASAKLTLPESTPDQKIVMAPMHPANSFENSTLLRNFGPKFIYGMNSSLNTIVGKECEPIIEFPSSPELESTESNGFEFKNGEEFHNDNVYSDIEDIPTIKLCSEEPHNCSPEEYEQDISKSKTLVMLHPNAANIHVPKMKNVSRLKTERLVYVLPDKHPLLAENTPKEPDDPSPYLLVVWTTGELENSCESTKNNSLEEENSGTVPGTLLIPCRTAMKGRFPLNGTYFQVNEVFADHASMIHPINVPRKWLWKLEKRIVYFGTGISSITRGFICVRAIDGKTRASRPISAILHRNTMTKLGKRNKNVRVNKE
ncbi:Protein ROS1, partial [Mucuna pruriens]